MAHNLATVNGQVSMWMQGKKEDAWHLLGQRTDTAQTWESASDLAGLSYPVEKQQLFDGAGRPVEAWGIFRTDNMDMLGSVGSGYTPFQNRNAFKTVDILMEAENGAHYDSAGALGKGEVIWCSAKVPCDFEVVPGDRVNTFLMFSTAHDGSRSSICKITATQVVCANTLQAALSNAGEFFRVKHTKNAEERIMRAADLMKGVGNNVTALKEKLQKLAAVKMTRESMVSILDRLFPKPKNEDACTTRRDNILADVLRLYESNNGNAFPTVRGSAYNLLNAVTEYTDHVRSAKGDNMTKARATSAMFGSGATLKENALEIILEASNSLPAMQTTRYLAPAPSSPSNTGTGSSLLDSIIENSRRPN